MDDDAFLRRLRRRMPAEIAASFTDAQLAALRVAFGEGGGHRIDWRRTVDLFRRRYYVVVLAGADRRVRGDGRVRHLRNWAIAVAGGVAIVALLLALLGLAYVVKRELGIDLVPGIDMLPDRDIEGAIGRR